MLLAYACVFHKAMTADWIGLVQKRQVSAAAQVSKKLGLKQHLMLVCQCWCDPRAWQALEPAGLKHKIHKAAQSADSLSALDSKLMQLPVQPFLCYSFSDRSQSQPSSGAQEHES